MKKILLVGLVGLLSCLSLAACSSSSNKSEKESVSTSDESLKNKTNEIESCLSSLGYHYELNVLSNNEQYSYIESAISNEIYYVSINNLYKQYCFKNGVQAFEGFGEKAKYQSKYMPSEFESIGKTYADSCNFYLSVDDVIDYKDNVVSFNANLSSILNNTKLYELNKVLRKDVLSLSQSAKINVTFENEKVSKIVIDATDVATYSGNKYTFELTYKTYANRNYIPSLSLSGYEEISMENSYTRFNLFESYQKSLYYSALEKNFLVNLKPIVDLEDNNYLGASLQCDNYDIIIDRYISLNELTRTDEKDEQGKTKYTYKILNLTYEIYLQINE